VHVRTDAISGAERGACGSCTACPGFEVWYSPRDGGCAEVLFYCSRCGCDASAHAVCPAWAAAQAAARRRAEAEQRERQRQREQQQQQQHARAGMQSAAAARAAHLATLGAPPGATRAQAAAAYRRAALRWHPDKHGRAGAAQQAAAHARFCAVAEAWRALCEADDAALT
jgi:hypothetical protein